MNKTLDINVGERYRFYGRPYEVLDIRNSQIQLRSTDRTKSVVFQKINDLQIAYHKGHFIKFQEAPFSKDNAQVIEALPEKKKVKFKKRLAYADAALEQYYGRLPVHATAKLISVIAEDLQDPTPPCYTTLYTWLKAYKESDRNPFSLLDPLCRKAISRLDRQHPEVRASFEYYVDLLYLTRPSATMHSIVVAVQISVEDLNSRRPAWDQVPVPSSSTLYRLINELNPLEVEIRQKGYTAALRDHGWSRSYRKTLRLFDLAECDTHTVDVMLFDELGRCIGKAFLTGVLMISIRFVIGYDLSLNPPSIAKTVRALKQSLSNMREFTGQAAHYVMDNGPDFRSVRLRERFKNIRAEITYCEPKTPNQKPHIESWFKTLVVQFTHHIKGTTYSNLEERGDYDSEQEAIYTLDELRKKFDEFLDIYHSSKHSALNMSPKQAWTKMQADQFPPRRYSPQQLDGLFASVAPSKVTNGRVRHNNLFWTGPGVAKVASLLKADEYAMVVYDESELGQVKVYHPRFPNTYYTADAIDPAYQSGLTMYTHNLVRAKLIQEGKQFSSKAANEAKLRLLVELALEKSKTKRRKNAILKDLEKMAQNLPPEPEISPHECNGPEAFDSMLFLDETSSPNDYAAVEVHHERSNRKATK